MMDSLYKQIRDANFSNWLDVAVGISITTKGISEYLEHTALALHHDIKYGPCALLPTCKRNCSKSEQHLSTWCVTCTEWKKQIMLFNRFRTRTRNIKWKEINSSEWPHNVNEMVKVFAPDWWGTATPYSEDLSVALHVFHNCTKFNIPIQTCHRVRNIRNALFAHGQLQVNKVERKHAIRDLVTFLKQPEIRNTESVKLAITQLNSLKSKCVIDHIKEGDTADLQHHLVNVLNPRDAVKRAILDRSENGKKMISCFRVQRKDQVNGNMFLTKHKVLKLVLLFLLTAVWYRNDTTQTRSNTDKACVPLTCTDPCLWEPAFTFDGYLEDRPVLFGRKWLTDKVQASLMTTPSRGIMLTAEMGYGKSTLVSHLICSGEQSDGFGLHKYLLSYHLCKFDVISTQKPEYFIINLVSMLIKKLPEAGNAILTNKLALHFLQIDKCSEDPVGCIDATLVHPLRQLTFDEERYVIIDAIDECGESAAISMSLPDVLSKRIHKLPWWLKFFITARDINIVTSKLPEMQIIHEMSEDIQNQNDIDTFLTDNLFIHTDTFSRLFGTQADIREATNHILRISGSNFLYVTLAVKFWIDYPQSKLTDIPRSLNDLYAANLDRAFDDNQHLYDLARKVFEVLCTSYKRLRLEELEAILNVTKYPYDLRNLLGNQTAHFVEHRMFTSISIYHKTICDYLTTNSSGYHKYHISKYNGHRMFANYLLNRHNNSLVDILNLIIHVAESEDNELLLSFQHSKSFFKMNMSSVHHLHQMAKTKNSFLGTKLLISVLGNKHINNLTSANVTATFLAAAFGNSETLRALIEEDGDYFFRVNRPPSEGGLEDAVSYCKYKALWGYGLLDIASQNGHTEVVNILLNTNRTLLYFENGLGLNAVHLAAEHGHADILDKFLDINSTLADQHSLYLASKYGHLRSVLSLLTHGAKDTCVQCEDNFHWIANNTKRMQWHPCSTNTDGTICNLALLTHYDEVENVTFVLNDDERLIKCTTALEVAVQTGHKKIVSQLLNQTTHALYCREYGGRTPLLTAIKYNRSEILDIIVEKGGNLSDKCEHVYNSTLRHSQRCLNKNEKISLEKSMCPQGAGVEHVIALDGRKEIARHLESKGVHLDWNLQAESGNTPLHYAACNNEWEIILQQILIIGNGNIYVTASNGSLPIHSAVLCHSMKSYAALHHFYVRVNKQLVDDEGRGVFHYLVLGAKFAKNPLQMIHYLTSEEFLLNTSTKDSKLNNFLHYAAQGGNYRIFLYLCARSNVSLLLEVNDKNKNVIDVAFDNLPNQEEEKLCVDCSIIDLFKTQQNPGYDEVLSKEENIIYRIFQIISAHPDVQRSVDFRKYRRLAVMKGNAFLFWSIIMFQPRPRDVSIDKDLLTAFFSTKNPSKEIISILLQFSSEFCNETFEESLVHRIIRNNNNKFWVYFSDANVFFNALKPIAFWDKCYDIDGYNILHHAVMGGNYAAVEFLIDNGMVFSEFPLSALVDLVSLGVSHADIYVNDDLSLRPWREYRTTFIDKGEPMKIEIDREVDFRYMTKNFDKTTSYILSKISKLHKLRFSYFCKTKSKRLSLAHRAAVKGQLNLLVTMYETVGKRVLQCANEYRFTPLYFAQVFNHSDVVKFLQSKSVADILPYEMAELVFLQRFAAHNDSVQKNVPSYMHSLIRLTHPYLYNRMPTNNNIFLRNLMRMCFDFDKMLTEIFAMLKRTVDEADTKLAYYSMLKNYIRFSLAKFLTFVDEIERKTSVLLTELYSRIILMRQYRIHGFKGKLRVRGIIKATYADIATFHNIHSYLQCVIISWGSESPFYNDRIRRIGNSYLMNMSLQTIKEFYAFRRTLLEDIGPDALPYISDIPTSSFAFNYGAVDHRRIVNALLNSFNFKIVNHKSKFWNDVNQSSFPLHDD